MKTGTANPSNKKMSVALTSLRGRKVPLFVRVDTRLSGVVMDLDNGGNKPGVAENISVGGMFFRTEDGPLVGSRLYCSLIQGEGPDAVQLHAGGTVMHRQKNGVGIAFDRITPEAFNAISDMIANTGCFLLEPIEKHPAIQKQRRERPRKRRQKRWAEAQARAA